MNSLDDWTLSSLEKPADCEIVHGITIVGRDLDIIECWYSSSTGWISNCTRSEIISNNVVYWRDIKSQLPKLSNDDIK